MGRPICQHFVPSICRRARQQTGWPIREYFVQYADWTKCWQIGQNVGRWDVPSANVPSADWAKCSQMGQSHLQIGQNVGRSGKMLADGMSHLLTSRLQIGQSVARWGRPICRRPVCRLDKMSADWAKCWQMRPSHLPTARLQIGRCSQMGWNIYTLKMGCILIVSVRWCIVRKIHNKQWTLHLVWSWSGWWMRHVCQWVRKWCNAILVRWKW